MPEQFGNRYTSSEHFESSPLQVLSDEAVRPLSGVLMTHTSEILNSLPVSNSNRTTPLAEPPRIFPSTVPIDLSEIRPIIAQACSDSMSLTSWLNVRLPSGHQSEVIPAPEMAPSQSADFFVINVENEQSPTVSTYQNLSYAPSEHQSHHHHITTADNFLNNIREASSNAVNNSNSSSNNSSNSNDNNDNSNNNNHHYQRVSNNDDNNTDGQTVNTLPVSPEAREVFKTIQNHLPFVGLLITKGIYDHRSGTLCLFLLLVVFIKANNDLKREIAKQQTGSGKTLFHILCYIFGALAIIAFVLDDYTFFLYTKTSSFWNLLWNIIITDFVIKLLTVALKTLLTCLPANLLAFEKRGKYYLCIEATSQFYRSIVPMYFWMSYFKEAYQGPEVILGIIMASLYGATKVRDLLYRGKFFIYALFKFWQNVYLGSYPSKEQLLASGGICVICHEEYSSPVQLHCKHIFCKPCVSTWFDRERTCPLCRARITDDPIYRDGHTTHFLQFY